MSSFEFDSTDLARFAPFVVRSASHKSFLNEKDGTLWRKRFFVAFGNLLYKFENEDNSSLCGVDFLEHSTVKPMSLSAEHEFCISIAKCGGKTIVLSASSESERHEWIETIEQTQYITMSRRLEDREASSVHFHHRVEQLELQNNELDLALIESNRDLSGLKDTQEKQSLHINSLEAEVRFQTMTWKACVIPSHFLFIEYILNQAS